MSEDASEDGPILVQTVTAPEEYVDQGEADAEHCEKVCQEPQQSPCMSELTFITSSTLRLKRIQSGP